MLTTSKMLLKKKLLTYKRWLEYVPQFWNIEETLKKESTDLSLIEINRLKQIKSDQEQAQIFNKFITIIDKFNKNKKINKEIDEIGDFFTEVIVSVSDSTELDEAIKNFDFNFQAKIKLEQITLDTITDIINLYNGENKEELIEQINDNNNIYFKEYALYLLNETSFEYFRKKRSIYLMKH